MKYGGKLAEGRKRWGENRRITVFYTRNKYLSQGRSKEIKFAT